MSASSALMPGLEPASSAVDVAAPAVAQDRSRLALLDTIRLIAAIGIVWIHAAQSSAGQLLYPIGTFGVPFYTFVAVLFAVRSMTRDPNRTISDYIISRLFRVYLPFLAWTAVYVALTEAKALEIHHALEPATLTSLYAGGHQHLWFLPYLMLVTIAAVTLLRLIDDRDWFRKLAIVVLTLIAGVFCFVPEPAWIATRTVDIEFWRFAFRALPSGFGSIAFALATIRNGRLPRTSLSVALCGLAVGVTALLLEGIIAPLKPLRALAGFGITLIALLPLAPAWAMRWGRLGRHSYGIYLSHVVFLRLLVGYYEHVNLTPTLLSDIVAFVIAFVGASLLSVLMSRSKWTRWMLGE